MLRQPGEEIGVRLLPAIDFEYEIAVPMALGKGQKGLNGALRVFALIGRTHVVQVEGNKRIIREVELLTEITPAPGCSHDR